MNKVDEIRILKKLDDLHDQIEQVKERAWRNGFLYGLGAASVGFLAARFIGI